MNILFAILIQAPYKPRPVKFPESNIVIERFMLKGDEPNMDAYHIGNMYF